MTDTVLVITDGQGATIAGATITNNVVMISDGLPGPRGPQGPAGGAALDPIHFTNQSSWTINHNLGRTPIVELYTVGGVRMIAAVQHINTNQALASFDGPHSGYAVII